MCSSSTGPPQEQGFKRTTFSLQGRDETLKEPEEAFQTTDLLSIRFTSILQLGSLHPSLGYDPSCGPPASSPSPRASSPTLASSKIKCKASSGCSQCPYFLTKELLRTDLPFCSHSTITSSIFPTSCCPNHLLLLLLDLNISFAPCSCF